MERKYPTPAPDQRELDANMEDLKTAYGDNIPPGDMNAYLRESDHVYFLRDEAVEGVWHRVGYMSTTAMYKLLKSESFELSTPITL